MSVSGLFSSTPGEGGSHYGGFLMLQDESWAAPQAPCTPCVSAVCDGCCIDGPPPIVKIILIILLGRMHGVNAPKATQKSHYKL